MNRALPNRQSPLVSALAGSPRSLTMELRRLLSDDMLEDSQPSQTVQWISDLYAVDLVPAERATLRDAVTHLLCELLEQGGEKAHELLISLTELAEEIELLATGNSRTPRVLWNALLDCHDAIDAATVAGYLADVGPRRPESEWTRLYDRFREPVAIAATVGVSRHGVGVAIQWLYTTVTTTALRDDVMAALIVRFVREAPDELLGIIRSAGEPAHAEVRSDLFKWIARYGLTLAAPENASRPAFSDTDELDVAIEQVGIDEGGFGKYDVLNDNATSAIDAMRAWSRVELHSRTTPYIAALLNIGTIEALTESDE